MEKLPVLMPIDRGASQSPRAQTASASPDPRSAPLPPLTPLGELISLWNHYQPTLRLYCLRLLDGNHADAEDALGSVALKILDRQAGDEIVRDPLALFHRLLFTSCMDTHRRRRREVLHPTSASPEPRAAESAVEGCCCESAEQAYLRRELFLQVHCGLNALPGRLRCVLLDRINNRPYPDIARAHGISIENARKQVQLARDLLRMRLRNHDFLR